MNAPRVHSDETFRGFLPHQTFSTARVKISLIILIFLLCLPAPGGAARPDSAPIAARLAVSVGIAESFFRDMPESLVVAGREPSRLLMQEATGLQTEVKPAQPAAQLADALLSNEVQLGVFQGIEFAWQKQRHPELQPLVLAVNVERGRQSNLVVRRDSPAKQWLHLKGKGMAIPRGSREHILLFAELQCLRLGLSTRDFFSHIKSGLGVEDALDDVVDRTIDSVVVDAVAFKAYQRRKPGRCAQLRILCSSEKFPDTVVAFKKGVLDQGTLERFRNGLIGSAKSKTGQLLLTFWAITHFEEVPLGFDSELAAIRKAYPAYVGSTLALEEKISARGEPGLNRSLLASPTKK